MLPFKRIAFVCFQDPTTTISSVISSVTSPTTTSTTTPSTTTELESTPIPATTWLSSSADLVHNLTTPDPPLTLSVGAWQIDQEDLPIYVGSAAGFLFLLVILMAVTTWRCCLAPTAAAGARRRDAEKQNGNNKKKVKLHFWMETIFVDSLLYLKRKAAC